MKLGNSNLIGIDSSENSINAAKTTLEHVDTGDQKVRFVKATIEDVISDINKGNTQLYDFVYCSEFIEHAQNKQEFLGKCISVLKPGGYLCISEISKDSDI